MDGDAEGPTHASESDERLMYTTGLVTCFAIAISGVYPPDRPCPPSEKRNNRFMVHISEGYEWRDYYDAFRKEVEAAKAQGLQDLQAHVTACDAEADGPLGIQKSLRKHLRKLIGPTSPIHWYPYLYDDDLNTEASMALFSDRTVIVEQGPWRVPCPKRLVKEE
ncbi:hypothetical protein PG993_005728 [Apiospora rasikravindrae]|uniref:Uncharacterized protein n=1 Tax=Apiospora rasikravindrae TaxID=990691 RepID=A0ABR1T9N8_9PEZI